MWRRLFVLLEDDDDGVVVLGVEPVASRAGGTGGAPLLRSSWLILACCSRLSTGNSSRGITIRVWCCVISR